MTEVRPPALPAGSLTVNGFSFFNALSFQIILGAPVILYAKSLGASSFILGVIAAFTPVLTILQLPAARHLHRTGYRKLVLAGWGSRTIFTICIALLPLVPGISEQTRMALLLAALFAFNALRGFASGAWLPWLTAIVPVQVRGRFLSRDQAFMNSGALVALLVSSWVISGAPDAGHYVAAFGIGAAAALVSLWFIQRIPEADSPEELRRSATRVPWASMLRYPPFAWLLVFSTLYSLAIGGLGVFTVEFLVVKAKFAADLILGLGSLAFVGALAGLAVTGPWLDETGSKPWLARAMYIFALVIAGWLLLALSAIPAWVALVGVLHLLSGLAGGMYGVASARIAMSSVPAMGRHHFFALYTMITGLGLGAAPVIWGVMLDAMRPLNVTVRGFSINRYSVYFMVLLFLAALVGKLASRLHEGPSSPDFHKRG